MKESPLYMMIRTERDRLLREIEKNKRMMQKFDNGSIRILSGRYVYLCHRDNGEYISVYKGTIDSKEAQDAMNDYKQKRMYKSLIKRLKLELEEAEAYLKAGDRFFKKNSKEYDVQEFVDDDYER